MEELANDLNELYVNRVNQRQALLARAAMHVRRTSYGLLDEEKPKPERFGFVRYITEPRQLVPLDLTLDVNGQLFGCHAVTRLSITVRFTAYRVDEASIYANSNSFLSLHFAAIKPVPPCGRLFVSKLAERPDVWTPPIIRGYCNDRPCFTFKPLRGLHALLRSNLDGGHLYLEANGEWQELTNMNWSLNA